jgi:TonB-linked SusC/RagA family outer membrane protein
LAAATITIKAKNRTLKEVLIEIEKKTDYTFVYSSSTISVNRSVNLNCVNEPVISVLGKLCEGADISYSIEEKLIILSPVKPALGASDSEKTSTQKKSGSVKGRVVKGKVVDELGVGIPGATVKVKGTTTGVATDINGGFVLILPQDAAILAASFIGCACAEKRIDPNGVDTFFQFELKPESRRIEEVIVTGYQTISKERATGSFAVVTPKTLEGKLQTNILDKLEGQVSGLSFYKGVPVIRGTSTINANKGILYVVDGVPYEGSIDAINPADIVNVTILKDATAASIYGARSSNGVIVITTRSGSVGKTSVSYSGSMKFQGLPDRDYLNRMNTSEFIDLQKETFGIYPISRSNANQWQNDVQVLLIDYKDKKITSEQLETGLNSFRSKDRYNEVIDEYLRRYSITQQHNISFGGGNDIHRYNISANYQQDLPYEREQSRDRIGFNLKNSFNFFKWMKADVGILGSNVSSDYDNGVLGMSILNGGPASYYTLRDENGNPKQWYSMDGSNKSQKEIDRLNALGLLDETYIPLNEMASRHYTAKSNYLNLNFVVNFKLYDGLTADFRYQNERTDGYTRQYDTKNSNRVKRMINDATQIFKDGSVKNNIPSGGQLLKNDNTSNSYTLRGQLNYSNTFKDVHEIQAIVGAERRQVINKSEGVYRVGYDDQTLVYSAFDELMMNKPIGAAEGDPGSGPQSQNRKFFYSNYKPHPDLLELLKYKENDNRYLSYYANASYTYNRKATLNGSIRIDQSDLFGTNFKNQFKPLWSLGAHYVILEDQLGWLDRLVGRLTYGINGNVAKEAGPYTIVVDEANSNITNENQTSIQSPPNSMLRWEKTQVTNVAVDFVTFKGRLSGSVEFYNKKSSDLLGQFSIDPTLGWSSVLMNYASMYNRGVEINLSSTNVKIKNFTWTTNFIFGYNKNEITDVEASSESAYSYYSGANIRKGYPMGALFSVRYKGLDEKGIPMAYKKDGTVVKRADMLSKEDLVYSGTTNPPYNASLSNRLTYKGFDLSFMFIYYGGNVMRDVKAKMLYTSHPVYYTSNMDKDMMNFWRKAGDENDPNMNPAFAFGNSTARAATDIWGAADKHIQKGDYIKLRDLTLGYTLPSNILKKVMVQSVRVNFQAQNLWKWVANDAGLDPEVWNGSSLSPSRGVLYPATYTLGLSVNF